jgi:hypothetical protein
MIANAANYMGSVRDPLRSNIIILKNSFWWNLTERFFSGIIYIVEIKEE